jgi:hypothetical protein
MAEETQSDVKPARAKPGQVKVVMRGPSWAPPGQPQLKAGDVVAVDEEVAKDLIANGHADPHEG